MDWKTAAQCLGENLGRNGPTGYYEFTASEWLAWALKEIREQRNALDSRSIGSNL